MGSNFHVIKFHLNNSKSIWLCFETHIDGSAEFYGSYVTSFLQASRLNLSRTFLGSFSYRCAMQLSNQKLLTSCCMFTIRFKKIRRCYFFLLNFTCQYEKGIIYLYDVLTSDNFLIKALKDFFGTLVLKFH